MKYDGEEYKKLVPVDRMSQIFQKVMLTQKDELTTSVRLWFQE